MPVTVNKTNTKIIKRPGGWIRIVHDTGQTDMNNKAVTLTTTLTQAAIEKEAGVLLPKAQVKAIVEAALSAVAPPDEQELAAL